MLSYYFTLAWRGLRKAPWLSGLLVVTLAVGVAAGVTTNALRYMLARNPMPGKASLLLSVQDPDIPGHMGNLLSYQVVRQLGEIGAKYGVYAYTGLGLGVEVTRPDAPHVRADPGIRYTTRTFFPMFDVQIEAGRLWTLDEETDRVPVAVMSRDLVKELFSDDKAVGTTIRIGHTLYTVIGVTGSWDPKPRFYNLQHPAGPFGGSSFQLFLPVSNISMAPSDMQYQIGCPNSVSGIPEPAAIIKLGCSWFRAWYLAHSDHDAMLLKRLIEDRLPDIMPAPKAKNMRVMDVNHILNEADLVPGSVRVYALLGLAFLVLCTVNAGGMQISRVLRSREQIGIRRAMGASRQDIAKQYLVDSLLVGSVAGLAGILLTLASLHVVREHLRTEYANMAQMDGAVFSAMIALVLACSLLVGVVPAWLASMENPARTIKSAQ